MFHVYGFDLGLKTIMLPTDSIPLLVLCVGHC